MLGEDKSSNKGMYNSGVAGYSSHGIGTLGETTSGIAVEGLAVGSGAFVSKPKYSSIGVYGDADAGPGVYGYAHGTPSDSYGVGAKEDQEGRAAFFDGSDGDRGGGIYFRTHDDGYLFIGTTFEKGDVASIDGNGNETRSGTLTQHGTPRVRTSRSSGSAVAMFDERSSMPALEDMGEATLVNGATFVAIDRAFAGAIGRQPRTLRARVQSGRDFTVR